MRVYLIRHAESEENALGRSGVRVSVRDFNEMLVRSTASPLTELGRRQAQGLVGRLAGARIERLYVSPFKRALMTADALARATGLTPQVLPELSEVLPPPGSERRRAVSVASHFLRSYVRMLWAEGSHEGWRAGYGRARVAWAQVTAEPAKAVAAVSHAGLLGLMLWGLRRNPHWRVLKRDLSNGGISIVERAG
jgi:broad specificity phosphatase PhoE